MALPENAKALGHINSGWFPKKYASKQEWPSNSREVKKAYYLKHKPKTTADNWKRQIKRVGCSPELYEQLLVAQGGVCAICGKGDKRKLSVDHCHSTNMVRGLLCNSCNKILGLMSDNPQMLRKMADYLCQAVK
jgi:hypothetical protein